MARDSTRVQARLVARDSVQLGPGLGSSSRIRNPTWLELGLARHSGTSSWIGLRLGSGLGSGLALCDSKLNSMNSARLGSRPGSV